MSEEAAFLEALKANPADDTARLVYADWLDEHNEHDKAEYLRLVVRSAGGPEIFAAALPRLRELGNVLLPDWLADSAGCFEVAFLGAPPGWSFRARQALLDRVPNQDREEGIAHFVRGESGVWVDGLSLETASDEAEALWTEATRAFTRSVPEGAEWEYQRINNAAFHAQHPDAGSRWFVARPMNSTWERAPARFAVQLAGRQWKPGEPLAHQNLDVFVDDVAAMFAIDPEDARRVLYATDAIPLAAGLAYTSALAAVAEHRKRLKRHSLWKLVGEFVVIEVVAMRDRTSEEPTASGE